MSAYSPYFQIIVVLFCRYRNKCYICITKVSNGAGGLNNKEMKALLIIAITIIILIVDLVIINSMITKSVDIYAVVSLVFVNVLYVVILIALLYD